ncbi:MAG: cytochrome P450 [Sphingomonadales bacterium]|nr:cytochrome P450 [Sphingomonadales bacterium]
MPVPDHVPPGPDHVPPALVWPHAYAAFTHELADPFLSAARMSSLPPVVWCPDTGYGNPGWIVTRNALILEALAAPELFSSRRIGNALSALLGVSWKLNPLEFDPPEHGDYRKILNPFFTPRAVRELETVVRRICDDLLATFLADGACEFIGAFSSRLPGHVFLALLGLPADSFGQFMHWEDGLLRGADLAERRSAGSAILAYLTDFLGDQRRAPTTELMRGILAATIDGRRLSDDEVMGMIFVLYVGGLDTLNSTIGWIFRHLAQNPALQTRLRDNPVDIPAAVDEFTRAFAIATAGRTLTRDTEFHGVPMRRGDHVLLAMCLANLDPAVFDNPTTVDIDRPRAHAMPFAAGPHACLGMHLARRELRIVLEALLPRMIDIHVPVGGEYAFHSGLGHGIDRLTLAWTPA